MPIEIGGTFAGFRVLRRLGAGGMGEVYLVEHPHLNRREALKVISAAGADATARERFGREARAAAVLRHPGIVGVHDFGVEGNTPWFTMDYLDGADLTVPPRPDPLEVAEIVGRVADALDYAHRQGVIHRDIKPGNIMVVRRPQGQLDEVVVLDFGIAKAVDDAGALTGVAQFIGSLAYSAPESFGPEQVGRAADQYSLAVTAYWLLTGRMPLGGATPQQQMHAHLVLTPVPAASVDPRLAPADPVFARALAKDPVARFADCGEFAAALRNALRAADTPPIHPPHPADGDAAYAATVRRPSPIQSASTSRRSGWRWPLAILACAVVAAVLAGVGIALSADEPATGRGSGSGVQAAPAAPVDEMVVKVSTGCAVIRTGALYCWGDNEYGQVGDGTTVERPTAVRVSSVSGVEDVVDGESHKCVRVQRRVKCWGLNSSGQLGSGDTVNSFTPVDVGLSGVTVLTSGDAHTCAIADGKAYCWGNNRSGQIGQDVGVEAVRPSEVPLPGVVSELAAGGAITCAVVGGKGYCWGQLPNPGAERNFTVTRPQPIPVAGPVTRIAPSGSRVCAVARQKIYCWGNGERGARGDGRSWTGSTMATAVPTVSGDEIMLAGGPFTGCATMRGTLYCWGDPLRVGRGPVAGLAAPVGPVSGLSGVSSLAMGPYVTCVVADRRAYCWGRGDIVGNGGTDISRIVDRPVQVTFAE
ncbi:protein kinase [Gordonia sp. ABSL1-1]|uniref:protein kinase domain-containing protein n=1 Tax=Gordonia sp. ABSL1-1 TaxID=3053923 RepID=UPI00257439DA|nr:protein kinase [Gordonia sp. ABSL1-1]MDL9938234.1 protein kinase [Gordonia sp. ABSL1-1]